MGIGFLPTAVKAPRPEIPAVGMVGGWAPGQLGTRYPDNSGVFLPKEAEIVLQVHYHRTGKPEKDRTRVGLYFAKEPVEKPWNTLTITGMTPLSFIPAGKATHVEKGSGWVTGDATVYSVMPHMHLLGKSVKITMTPPGGDPRVLLDIARLGLRLAGVVLAGEADRGEGWDAVRHRGGVRQLSEEPEQPADPAEAGDVRRGDDGRDAVRVPRRGAGRQGARALVREATKK